MLIVIPVSKVDAHRISETVRAFNAFSPGADHKLLVVGEPEYALQVAELRQALEGHFVSSSILITPQDFAMGWPMETSYLFQQAAYEVKNHIQGQQPWLWYELDCLPLKENWATSLELGYFEDAPLSVRDGREMRRFMGVKERTLHSRGGELLPEEESGSHMAPVGVYPGDIEVRAPILNSLTGSAQRTFAEHIQWYVLPSLNETPLIQNNRSTINYTSEGCESVARNAWGFHWNKPVRNDAVLLHGVKDSSLLDMLAPKVEEVVPEIPEPAVTVTPIEVPIAVIPRKKAEKPKRRSRMSPEARKAQADRMKAMWEKRRAIKSENLLSV